MNVTDMASPTVATSNVTEAVTRSLTTLSAEVITTVNQDVTTALPPETDNNAIIAVVIAVILLTVAVLGFLVYRYFCHNKGDYRTTGELAPGEDPDEEYHNQTRNEKKEYFI